jgi:pyruvate formate lyase activating enzyme
MNNDPETLSTTALFLNTKRFAVHDGPGIRTTIFLKGCPLRCRWCHNPESMSPKPRIGFWAHKCIGCGECVEVCPNDAHRLVDGVHLFDREACTACGKCVEACLSEALELYGQELSVDEAVSAVLEDRDFYATSGGGVTFSGGEPLLQADFCADVFKRLKTEGVHCAIDTCGAVPWEKFETVLPYTDMFLFDVKHVDEQRHLQHTGRSCRLIQENLVRLASCGVRIEIRIPVIPEFNDDPASLEAIGERLSTLANLSAVRLLPYHDFARSKYAAIGASDTMPDVPQPTPKQMAAVATRLLKYGLPIKH